MANDLRIFALDSGRDYAGAVAAALGTPLGAHEERVFEDGEHKSRPLESVRGADVYVVQSIAGTAQHDVDAVLMRLLFFVAALKDAAAARVTVVAPYLAYARKDQRTKPRDPVTTRYIASFLEAAGAAGMVAIDVHNVAAYQNAYRCCCEHLAAAPLFVAHLLPRLGQAPVTVVSPDAGAIKRADALRLRLAAALGRPVDVAFVEKYRSEGTLRGGMLVGDVAGRVAVIVDDLVSAGNTIARAARACRAHGATGVVACATHGVFAAEANVVLADAPVDEIVVTDTLPPWRLTEPRVLDRLQRVSTVPLVADAIRRMHEGGSLVALAAG